MFRLWLLKLFPFMEKWLHFAPACCGACPTCATAGITGIALDLLASRPRSGGELPLVDRAQHRGLLEADALRCSRSQVPGDPPAEWASVDHGDRDEATVVVEGHLSPTRQGLVGHAKCPAPQPATARGPVAIEPRSVPGRPSHAHQANQRGPRAGTHDAVHVEAAGTLERTHGGVGGGVEGA